MSDRDPFISCLFAGETWIGTLDDETMDFPKIYARFVPTEAFEAHRAVFDRAQHVRMGVTSMDEQRAIAAELDALDLRLADPWGDVTELLRIAIAGDRAMWRMGYVRKARRAALEKPEPA